MAFHKVCEKVVRPQDICFTQESICVTFKRPREEERIDDAVELIIQKRLSPKAFPNMNVVQCQDRLWSLDNRRLWVFKKAEVALVTVTIVTYDTYNGLQSLMSSSPHMYYTLSKRDFFPRIRGHCKEVFADEDPEEPYFPPLPSTPRGRVHKVYNKSNHFDYEDQHHRRPHLPPPAKKSRASDSAAPAWTPYGECSSPLAAQKLRGHAPHHRREFTTPAAAQKVPTPVTPERRPKAPRSPEREIRAAPSFTRESNPPSSRMKPRTERMVYPRSGDLASYRTTEPKVLHSREKRQGDRHPSQLPSREKRAEKGPAVPSLSREKRGQRDREATSASQRVENPKSTLSQLKRSKPPKPTSSPPNFSYDFHSSQKRPRAASRDFPKDSKKTTASCPSTKSESSTRLNHAEPPQVPSPTPPKTLHAKSKIMSTAPLPSSSTTAGPSRTTKRKQRADNFTASDLPIPSVPAPKSPPATSKKLQELNSGTSPTTKARQESPALVNCEIMTQIESDLFKLHKQEPVAQDPELHLRVTPGKELTPQDRQTLDAIVELFLRGNARGSSPLQPAQVKSTVEPETEHIETSVIPTDEVCAKPHQEEELQDVSVRVDTTPTFVVECPVKYDSKGQLFECTLKGLGPLSNPSTTCFGDGDRQRATGNVGNVTVTADLEPPAAQSTPVCGRQVEETQPETKGNATDHQHAAPAAKRKRVFKKRCRKIFWIAKDKATDRLTMPIQELSIPGNGVQIEGSKRITRSQIKQYKELERREARQKRKEEDREAKAKAMKDSEAESLPEKEREAKAKAKEESEAKSLQEKEREAKAKAKESEAKESEAKALQEKEKEAKANAKKESEAKSLLEKEREAKAKKEIEAKALQEKEKEAKAEKEIEGQALQEKESSVALVLVKAKESEPQSVQKKPRRKTKAKKAMKKKSRAKLSPKEKPKKNLTTDIVPYDPEKSKEASSGVATDIVPYDPERSKEASSGVEIVQNGELVYVKVDAEFTKGRGKLGFKKNRRSKIRLHPYLRIIGPFTVLGRYNPYAVRLELPDDCYLKPTFSLKALLTSRSPLDNYLPEKRLPLMLEPEIVLKKRVARRLKRRKVLHYLVKWKTLPYSEATWESETIFDEYPRLLNHIDDCPVFLNPFLQRNWRA